MKSVFFAILFNLFLCTGVGSLAQAPSKEINPEISFVQNRFASRWLRGGLYLEVDGIPLLKGGNLQLFSSDYKKGYYSSGSNVPAVKTERLADGGIAYLTTYRYQSDGRTLNAEQRTEVHPDNSVNFSLQTDWDAGDPAKLEWNPIRLWAYALAQGKYEISSKDLKTEGDLPSKALPAENDESRIGTPSFTSLKLNLPLVGQFEFLAESSPSLIAGQNGASFNDTRNDPYLQQDRLFRIGLEGATLTPGPKQTFSFKMNWIPGAKPQTNLSVPSPSPLINMRTGKLKFRSAQESELNDEQGHPIVIPEPKHIVFDEGDFQLRGAVPIRLAFPNTVEGERAERASRRFATEMSRQTGVKWQDNTGQWKEKGLLVTVQGADPLAHPLTPALTSQPEGYALVVTPKFVAVVGRDPAGAFYGLQTLRQLLRTNRGRSRFVGADISDWPSLAFRGAHLFVGKNALPFHKKLIDRIFSRYKLNALVIECEYAKWKSHPELHVPYGMEPGDLREEVVYARDRFMEPIPLVNTLGHSEWIFKNGQHKELAEDVNSPHAYDASAPETYKFVFDIFTEALDIFKPNRFHIGHDEVKVPSFDQFGKYPARPQNLAKGATTLFIEDSNRLADWLRERGVRTMMWGDMALYESEGDPTAWDTLTAANAPTLAEAQRIRSLLPKDAIIADWRYHPGSEQRNGLSVLKLSGHDTLGCPWFEPENIRGWAQQATKNESSGILETTWAGYDSAEELLEDEYKQFHAFVLAGEYAWSAADKHPQAAIFAEEKQNKELSRLPYRQEEVFNRSYREENAENAEARSGSGKGWQLKLNSVANISLQMNDGSQGRLAAYSGARRETSLSSVETNPNDYDFKLPGDSIGGLLCSSRLAPNSLPNIKYTGNITLVAPQNVSLTIRKRATKLVFLQSSFVSAEQNAPVASYVIHYRDGKTSEILLRYGKEIRALDDKTESNSFSTKLIPVEVKGTKSYLRQFQWNNPRPETVMDSIDIVSRDPLAGLIVFAIAGIE